MNLLGGSILPEPIWSFVVSDWHEDVTYWLRHKLPPILLILVVAVVLTRVLGLFTGKLQEFSKREELPSRMRAQQLRTLAGIIQSVGIFIVCFFALLQILPFFNVDVKPLLASAGVVGLAIGFGAQTLVHDVINGFFILIENIYDIGDVVKIAGVQGTVEQMTLRKTVLRDETGAVHSVPNSAMQIITNMTRDWAQVALHVSVDYSESSDRILQLLKDVGADLKNDSTFGSFMVGDVEVPGIERVSGSEVDYLVVVKVRPGKQFDIRREFRKRIKECFEKNNIKAGAPNRMYVMETPPALQN